MELTPEASGPSGGVGLDPNMSAHCWAEMQKQPLNSESANTGLWTVGGEGGPEEDLQGHGNHTQPS